VSDDSTATNDAINNAEFSSEIGDDACTVCACSLDDVVDSNNNYVSQLAGKYTNDVEGESTARNTGSNNAKI
jgi:hypothetical protein